MSDLRPDKPQPLAAAAAHLGENTPWIIPGRARAPDNSPQTGAHLTTLDPGAGFVTTINTYTVTPDRAEELLNMLVRLMAETLPSVPGFVSANLHVSADRTQVINYGQWRSREAIAAAVGDPKTAGRMQEVAQIASSITRISCELRQCIAAAGL
jgi:quinol monooxygenase YgiN